MSNRALITLADALRRNRITLGTRWRRLHPAAQALLVLAHLHKCETYADLAVGFGIGTTTVFRYIREALELLAALAPTLGQAIETAARKGYVILDGTLLRIDRVGMATGRDRPYYSGKHKAHGVNVQVLADPAGRLIWASPALPGARHDLVGILASGEQFSGFANSLGQRNWHSSHSFNFDWSFYHQADKAVKMAYAGFAWEPEVFARKVDLAARQLEVLRRPPRTVPPARNRPAYYSPNNWSDPFRSVAARR